MSRYAPAASRAQFAESERTILEFWREARVFERTLEWRKDAPRYVFYEGPPTANGLPGLHHVISRAYKDIFARHRAMCGFLVERKAGWDTHGLPVELEVERQLKISGKKQIEEFGIERFNQLCRESVNRYIGQWREMSERLAFWLDFDHPYRTYDSTYIESIWWSLSELWKRDLLYQGYKVAPYCPRCQTSLSSHELSQGYQEDTPDPSVYVKFRLEDSDGTTFLLAWTTTPWTLPGNVALAVHPDADYVRVEQHGESLILAKQRLVVLEGDFEVVEQMKGADLVDLTYEPLFTDNQPDGLAFIVLEAPELVNLEEGTGVVHTAAAYGVADLELCQRKGIAIRHVVGLDGRFMEPSRWAGVFVKDADPEITDDLSNRGLLYKRETITHTYPFCWRCDTPLLYYALTSWFIRTTADKAKLISNNRTVNWQPLHIRDGRMGNWLESLVDWNLSRSRYWGTPLPLWVCDACGERRCVGSTAELGLTVDHDLHKPFIDTVTLQCEQCDGTMHRVPDVIDCWYDSGAMPFAQRHYPFENRELFETTHPADFICEGLDQTRGWFFSLLAESTLVFDQPAYRNCVVVGVVVDRKGKKMSKTRGNTISPDEIFDEFGADAARWFFYTTGALAGELRVSRDAFNDVVRLFMLTLWNVHSFFITYADLDDYDPALPAPEVASRPALDRWCLARLAETVDTARASLDAYDAVNAARTIEAFVEDVSKWYVRRSRRRFWSKGEGAGSADKQAAYATLHTVLLTVARLVAPMMPYLAERMYRNLCGFEGDRPPRSDTPDSVHLTEYPVADATWHNPDIVHEMARLRRLVEDGLAARTAAGIKVRQPLASATVHGLALRPEFAEIFTEELNVKEVRTAAMAGEHDSVTLDTVITDDLRLEGVLRDLVRKVNEVRKQAGLRVEDRIVLLIEAQPQSDVARALELHRDHLMAETLSDSLETQRNGAQAQWEGTLGGTSLWVGVRR